MGVSRAAEGLLAGTGDAVTLCPVYGVGRIGEHIGGGLGNDADHVVGSAGVRSSSRRPRCPTTSSRLWSRSLPGWLPARWLWSVSVWTPWWRSPVGLIILWQFRHRMPESREQLALRMLAVSFFALAAYVGIESSRALVAGTDPDASPVGIGLAMASLVVMPVLSWAQRRTGRALGSQAVVADGTQTLLCTYLSGVLLVGLVANATLGWWWADPTAGLVIAAVALREGVEAWRGEGCCAPARGTLEEQSGDAPVGCADACCEDGRVALRGWLGVRVSGIPDEAIGQEAGS